MDGSRYMLRNEKITKICLGAACFADFEPFLPSSSDFTPLPSSLTSATQHW